MEKTGTGLDRLVEIIETDAGIKRKVSASDLQKGAQAANELNHMLVDGIHDLGLANDGKIGAADLRGLGDWVRADSTRHKTFLDLYGTNRNGGETGFQLVENEDSSNWLWGEDAVDEVADAIYSFGFGNRDGRLLDVDGKLYRSVALTASWLDDLLTDADMKVLSNADGSAIVTGTTGTGLDLLVDIVQTDPGLVRNVSRVDMAEAARAVDAIHHMYLKGMTALGIANDGTIDSSDVVALSNWVRSDAGRAADFDESREDYLLVLHKGEQIGQIDEVKDGIHPHPGHVINHGMNSVYEVGLGVKDYWVVDDAGKPHISTQVPATWLDQLLTDEQKADLGNPDGSTIVEGTTGTGLDQIIDIIKSDPGLIRNISRTDIAEGARASDALNQMIVGTIEKLGLADDGRIDYADVKKINGYIRADDALHDEFLLLHCGGANGQTGFHEVQGKGGSEELFGKWAVNNVFDGVYSVGFDIEKKRFLDSDGDPSYSVALVSEWIDELYFA